jgi:WD40 repeat protein
LGSAAFDLSESVAAVAWSPDGRFLASESESTTRPGHFQIDVWKAETGERIWRRDSQVRKVRSLQFSSDGRAVIETGSETASAMDVATGKRVPLPMSTEPAVTAQLLGDQKKILVKHPPAGNQEVTIACPGA